MNRKAIFIYSGIFLSILLNVIIACLFLYQGMANRFREQGYQIAATQIQQQLAQNGSVSVTQVGKDGKQETVILVPKK